MYEFKTDSLFRVILRHFMDTTFFKIEEKKGGKGVIIQSFYCTSYFTLG